MTRDEGKQSPIGGLGFFMGAMVVGPTLGFFGPLVVLAVAIIVLHARSDVWFTIAPIAPFAYGVAMVARRERRAWGYVVLAGTAGGLALLVLALYEVFKDFEITF